MVEIRAHTVCPATECELCYRKKNVALQHNSMSGCTEEERRLYPNLDHLIRSELPCVSPEQGSVHSLDTRQDFPFGLLAILAVLALSGTQSALSKSQPLFFFSFFFFWARI